MSDSFVDRFGAVAGYAELRPGYPPALFAWLASQSRGHGLAWDCATGTGQAAQGLAAQFDRVVATDASAGQIDRAKPHPRIEYRVAPAEDSGLAPESVDLVSVAQALHWLDIGRFFAETGRVLRPSGVLAVWTYGRLCVAGREVDELIQGFYHEIVGPYWPGERALVDAGYQSIVLPFPEVEPPPFEMTVHWPLARLLGYLGTWSATMAYKAAVGRDPIERILGPLSAVWGSPAATRAIRWPLNVRVGLKISV